MIGYLKNRWHCKNGYREVLVIALPLIIIFGHQPYELLAQERPARFTLRLNGGVAVMPLEGWDLYAGRTPDGRYSHAIPDFIGGMTIGFKLTPGHSLSLEIEKLTTSTTIFGVQKLISARDSVLGIRSAGMLIRAYTGVPVTLIYTRHFGIKSGSWSPYIGVGLSYYMTEVQVSVDYLHDPLGLEFLFADLEPRKATGNGLALMAGIDIPLTARLYLNNQLRYRWADGTAYDQIESIPASFTGYDLSIGLSWHI